jgi:hypothetical protein
VTRLAIVASFALAATAHAPIAAAQSSDPRQTAEYLQRTALISALDVATRYLELPLCSEANKPPCSDRSIIHEVLNTAEMAGKAMNVAQALSEDLGPAGITAEPMRSRLKSLWRLLIRSSMISSVSFLSNKR